MTQILRANMSAEKVKQLQADHQPTAMMKLTFDKFDIETALEFWLNNVVLRHPVNITQFTQVRGTGDVSIYCERKPANE